jgi:hypothetical protein
LPDSWIWAILLLATKTGNEPEAANHTVHPALPRNLGQHFGPSQQPWVFSRTGFSG